MYVKLVFTSGQWHCAAFYALQENRKITQVPNCCVFCVSKIDHTRSVSNQSASVTLGYFILSS